jgi:ABC-type branched-subunit amino acid transport system substrate-binding protein
MSPRRTRSPALAALAGLALLAAACGSSNKSTGAAPSTVKPATPTAASTGETQATTAAKALANAPGFDGKTIKLGVITALSGSAAVIGKQLAAGQDVFWKYYNAEKGGIAGKYPVQLVVEDSLYESNTTVQEYNKIKNDVVMVGQVMGTAPTLALLPLLQADKVVAAPASQDAMWVREQNLFPVIEPYQVDAINAMDYLMKEGGAQGKSVCVVMQNDVYGQAGNEGVQFAATKLGFDVKTVAKFKLGDQDFTAQVNQLKNAGCQEVFAVALPTEFGKILGTAASLGYAPQWVGQSPAWVDALLATPLKDYLTKNVLIAAVGPQWGDPSVPAAKTFADRVKQYKPDQAPNYYFSFGYFQAQAEAQLLEKAAAMGSLSHDGVVAAMNSLDKLSFEGLAGDYGYGPPDQRNPSRVSTMFKVTDGAPFGLTSLKYNFTSDAAQAYVFPTNPS